MKCIQGKGIVNSNIYQGRRDKFIEHAKLVRRYGAAVMRDGLRRTGQAGYDAAQDRHLYPRLQNSHRADLAFRRRHQSSTRTYSQSGTGIEETQQLRRGFIEATRVIKQTLPHALVSGGVSNVSFCFEE